MSEEKNNILASLLASKLDEFGKYYKVSLLLGQVIEQNDFLKIISALNSREEQISRINKIDAEIAELTNDFFPRNESVRESVISIMGLIKNIQASDNQCLAAAMNFLEKNSKGAASLRLDTTAFCSYGKKQAGSKFLDVET